MAPVRAAYGGDIRSVPRGSEPVVDCCANTASLDRRFARTMMAGDQQQDAIAAGYCLLEAPVDGCPSAIEVHPVEVEHAVGLDGAAAQPLVPASIQRLLADRRCLRRWRCGRRDDFRRKHLRSCRFRVVSRFVGGTLSRQRADGDCYAGPELRFFRAERPHAPRRPWGQGSAPRRSPTCRPRSPLLADPIPRRCQNDLVP